MQLLPLGMETITISHKSSRSRRISIQDSFKTTITRNKGKVGKLVKYKFDVLVSRHFHSLITYLYFWNFPIVYKNKKICL